MNFIGSNDSLQNADIARLESQKNAEKKNSQSHNWIQCVYNIERAIQEGKICTKCPSLNEVEIRTLTEKNYKVEVKTYTDSPPFYDYTVVKW